MIKRVAKAVLPARFRLMLRIRYAEAREMIGSAGWKAGLSLLSSRYLERFYAGLGYHPKAIRRVRLPGYRYPFYYRLNSSDFGIVWHVLIRRDYDCVAHEKDVSLILDCGANIGCASFFFLHQYPEARVIAVEPDSGNFELCRRNLEPFKDRVILENSGIWPVSEPLRVIRGDYRDGQEWSFQVRPTSEGERPDVMGVSIPDLVKSSEFSDIDLLKIDIEAAERELFSRDVAPWLSRTRHIAIELHGPECERVFFDAIADYDFDVRTSGELTICNRNGAAGRGESQSSH